MKRLSELQYTSRMQGGQNSIEPADITAGDMMDDDIFGEYVDTPIEEPADVTQNDIAGTPYDDPYDEFFEPADVTPGDMYENIILTEANPFRKKRRVSEKYGVYSKGGSIGSKNSEPLEVFDTAEEAKDYAKRMRKLLTPGERSYYKMGYITKPIKEAHSHSPGDEFDNEFSVTVKDAKKLSRTYGCEWDTDGDEWIMTDVDEHVFTYLPKQGKLFTDFDQDQVIEMINEPPQGIREATKAEVKKLQKTISKNKKAKTEYEEWCAKYSDNGFDLSNADSYDLSNAASRAKKLIRQYSLEEGAIPPSELVNPDSEFSITDEYGNIPDELASVGNYRNPDNEINQMEDMFGRDRAVDMLAYRNSLKQRMHKHLFDTHEWDAEDDQSDWDGKIDYFYGDLHDNYSDEEEWNDDEAREVARTHMYGHPRWDENATKLDCLLLEEALLYYQLQEAGPITSAAKMRNLLVKELGGKPIRPMPGGSNPYNSTQKLEVKLTKKALKQLPQLLDSLGWYQDDEDKQWYRDGVQAYRSPDNDKMKVVFTDDSYVAVIGPKKAKRSSLPIYD